MKTSPPFAYKEWVEGGKYHEKGLYAWADVFRYAGHLQSGISGKISLQEKLLQAIRVSFLHLTEGV